VSAPDTGRAATPPPILPHQVAPDDLDDPFWAGCVDHEFLLHRCRECGRAYWPASSCLDHGTTAMEWVPARGTGEVFTYTVFHHAYDPRFADRVPYALAVVQLDEGPFFHTDILECDAGDVYVGMRVEVVYEDVAVDLAIPHFRPTHASADREAPP
jgi:uncharacterized OB-fold protein